MSKPSFLTDEQYERIYELRHEVYEFEQLLKSRQSRNKTKALLEDKEMPLAHMASSILSAVEKSQESVRHIESMRTGIREAEAEVQEANTQAEQYYRAMKLAYPDADVDDFLEMIEHL